MHRYHSDTTNLHTTYSKFSSWADLIYIWLLFYSANKIPFLVTGEQSYFPVHCNNLLPPHLLGHWPTHDTVLKKSWTKGTALNLMTLAVFECFNYVTLAHKAKITNDVLFSRYEILEHMNCFHSILKPGDSQTLN